MIVGVVNDKLEATLRLPIEDASGHLHPTLVTIDTGFTGHLTLPSFLVSRLGLMFLQQQQIGLGNGGVEWVDVYEALVVWDMTTIRIKVWQVETDPLIGTQLLDGYQVQIEFRDGGRVVIEQLP